MCHYAVLWSAFRVSGSRSLMSRSRRIREARALPSVTDLFLSPLPRSMSTTRTVRSDCHASLEEMSSCTDLSFFSSARSSKKASEATEDMGVTRYYCQLKAWFNENGRKFLKHYLIDFSDALRKLAPPTARKIVYGGYY